MAEKKTTKDKQEKTKKEKAPTATGKGKKSDKKSTKNKKEKKYHKRYREALKAYDKKADYSIEEAVSIVKKMPSTKFDASVEIHLNLNIDPKDPEQQVRGSVALPEGIGKEKKIAVICDSGIVDKAKKYGADYCGSEDLIEKIAGGWLDFDVLLATPEMMPKIAKLGKILGPKGLMPSPKDNTVTNNLESTIKEIKKGRADFKADSLGIVHSVVGRVSFSEEQLVANIKTFIEEIKNRKPQAVKKEYIKSAFIAPAMGPSVKIKLK